MLLQIHQKKTTIKLLRGLLITLAAASSGTCIWLFSGICFSFPHGSQPFMCCHGFNMFQASTACIITDPTLVFLQHPKQPRHISSVAACSSAGASASATSSEAGSWQCRYSIKCQVELVEISPTHVTVQQSIFTNLVGAYSHMFTKTNLRTHTMENGTGRE